MGSCWALETSNVHFSFLAQQMSVPLANGEYDLIDELIDLFGRTAQEVPLIQDLIKIDLCKGRVGPQPLQQIVI